MSKLKSISDWIVLGDYSRYIFLKWLVPTLELPDLKDCPVKVEYSKDFSVNKKDEYWYITTYKLLPQMTLLILPTDYKMSNLSISENNVFVLFEEFPFLKQSSKNLLEEITDLDADANILVLLMDLERHQGSTDITKAGEDVNLAMQEYAKNGFCVIKMKNQANLNKVLHWHKPLNKYWKDKAFLHLKELEERINDVKYDYESIKEDWQYDKGILSIESKNRICSFNSVQQAGYKSIWDSYCEAAFKLLFPYNKLGGLYDIADLYVEVIDNPIVLWDSDADKNVFMTRLQKRFGFVMSEPSKYGYNRRVITSEIDYLQAVAKPNNIYFGINKEFIQQLEKFIEKDVLAELENLLNKRYKYLKGLMI